MFKKNIKFKSFEHKNNYKNKSFFLKKFLQKIIQDKSQLILSMSDQYKDSYSKKFLKKITKYKKILLVGMGGSILGAKAIYNFLEKKKKKFEFTDNISNIHYSYNDKKKLQIIISKSGNTLETVSNLSVHFKTNDKKIFLAENKKNFLMDLAQKLKDDVVYHNNFIGGRYSVLSEVGMLPAELMGFKSEKFRRLNLLIKDKFFFNSLVQNVIGIYEFIKKKKTNSIILNYDDKSIDFFHWYQQLTAESLGKKNKGILPFISSMPKDNHSLMQYYLDGVKNNFFTFFFVKDKKSPKITSRSFLKQFSYLQNKTLNQIAYSQFLATEQVFKEKKIPFRSFVIQNRSEEALGDLFIFFILETILLGKLLKIDPFDQPAVELIKKKTRKILANK